VTMDDRGGARTDIPVLDVASRQARAPWAASVAGILFAVLFITALAFVAAAVGCAGSAGERGSGVGPHVGRP
jgi:hypothetical protein